jgi:hypothetical protein
MQNFDDRLRRIDQQHRAMSRGFVLSVSRDGLVVAKPESRRARFPWRVALFMLLAVMGFKVMLHAYMGDGAYNERVTRLANGTTAEQIGAYVLAADPITVSVSNFVTGQ